MRTSPAAGVQMIDGGALMGARASRAGLADFRRARHCYFRCIRMRARAIQLGMYCCRGAWAGISCSGYVGSLAAWRAMQTRQTL